MAGNSEARRYLILDHVERISDADVLAVLLRMRECTGADTSSGVISRILQTKRVLPCLQKAGVKQVHFSCTGRSSHHATVPPVLKANSVLQALTWACSSLVRYRGGPMLSNLTPSAAPDLYRYASLGTRYQSSCR